MATDVGSPPIPGRLPGFPLSGEAPRVDRRGAPLLRRDRTSLTVWREPQRSDVGLSEPVEAGPVVAISSRVRQHSCGRRDIERIARRNPSNCSNHPLVRRTIARCRKNDWRRCERFHRSHRSTSNPK